MRKVSLIVVIATAVLATGCYTRAYQEAVRAQQTQSAQSTTNQLVGQPNK